MEINSQYNNLKYSPNQYINPNFETTSQPNIKLVHQQNNYYNGRRYNDQFATLNKKLPNKKANNIYNKPQRSKILKKPVVFDNTLIPYSNRFETQNKYHNGPRPPAIHWNNPFLDGGFNSQQRIDSLIDTRNMNDAALLRNYGNNIHINSIKAQQIQDLTHHRDQIKKLLNIYKVPDQGILQNIARKYGEAPDNRMDWFDKNREEIFRKKIKNDYKKNTEAKFV